MVLAIARRVTHPMSIANLDGHHARVLDELLEHRGRNLEWRDILSLMERLGAVVERHDGKYEFQIGTANIVLPKPHGKDVSVDELAELRRFLKQAGVGASTATSPSAETPAAKQRTVVLVDHFHARFFEPDPGSGRLQERDHLEPKNPHNLERILKEGQYQGERAPEAIDFYERIAQRLKDASSIVLIGDGTGKSSAMRDLLEYLKSKHKDVAGRVITTADADLSSITLPEIEKIASR